MLDKIKKAAGVVAGTMTDALGAGFDKLKGPLDELAASSEALEKLGYRVGEIELEFSLPPRIIVHLVREAVVSDEAFQAALANNAANRTFCLVTGLLRQANRVVDKVQIKGRRMSEVEVGLGIIPSVRLKYAGSEDRHCVPRTSETTLGSASPPASNG
jgi:hypothetical protein